MAIILSEKNLLSSAAVQLRVSVTQPTGIGALAVDVLLNETAHGLDGQPLSAFHVSHTYDTFHGQHQPHLPDWYEIEFAEPTTFNCVEMTMGIPHHDGGWWSFLTVEISKHADGNWLSVETLQMMPTYNFADTAYQRRPFETYRLVFPQVTALAVRLIGSGGGSSHFTSLARLAVYHYPPTRLSALPLPPVPTPRIFQLIPPHAIWDLSFTFTKAVDLMLSIPFIEYYMNPDLCRYPRSRLAARSSTGPVLWQLIAHSIGWSTELCQSWAGWTTSTELQAGKLAVEPYVRLSWHDTMAQAVAPIIVDGQLLGEMCTHPVLLAGELPLSSHKRYAAEYALPWSAYKAALERSPRMTLEKMEGVAAMLGLISNRMANLAHQLDRALSGQSTGRDRRKELVRQALAFMEQHLASSITVADVAQALNLSPSYFCVLFTEETGQNPRDILIKLRIERAKAYLTHTSMSVQEVCRALGYDTSYLMRLFKRHTGQTLGQYARQMRQLN